MNQNNQNNRNNNNRNGKSRQNNQNRQAEEKESMDKKAPMQYQIRKTKETKEVEFKCEIDGVMERTKINVYEDGNDEEYLNMIKDFQNYLETFEIWANANAARIVYRNFRRCLSGAAKDLWDDLNTIAEDEERDELTFNEHIEQLTSAVLGAEAFENQKDYLKSTRKPDKMSVKDWINRIKNINSYLPLMEPEARSFSERELIAEVISKNIPSAWKDQFKLSKLHLKTRIKDIMGDLTIIEEVNHSKSSKKPLKNPCRVHNGSHEWEDCRQNPKNQQDDKKNEGKNKHNENNRNRRGNENDGRSREESRRTERDERQSSRERSQHHSVNRNRSESSDSDSDHEIYCVNLRSNNNKNDKKKVPSSEILVAIPDNKGSKKYTTYLGLIDSGSSGSLVNKDLVEFADFNVKMQRKPVEWDTANGMLKTEGTVLIENYCLPQFSRKHHITTPFHMFHKRPNDKYDFFLGRDLLNELGLDIRFSTSQFVWKNVTVDMVPKGHWTQTAISAVAGSWNTKKPAQRIEAETKQKSRLATTPSADCKPVAIIDVVQQQLTITPEDHLLYTLTTGQLFYEENIKARLKQETLDTDPSGVDNAVQTSPAQDYQQTTQKHVLATFTTQEKQARPPMPYLLGHKSIVVEPDADEHRNQPNTNAPSGDPPTISQIHTNETDELSRGSTIAITNMRHDKPYYN
jgi:hypothetical protein